MSNEKVLEPTKESFKIAAECVKSGGVIVAPSDTNLALTLDPWNDDAIERAFSIKNRPATSPLTLFFLEPLEWSEYGIAKDKEIITALADAFWPGPLNIVLRKKNKVPNKLVCNGDTVSLGCLSNPVWRGFMEYMNQPVSMTSANLSGQADGILVDMNIAMKQVGDQVDYILKGGAQRTTKSSTIIDLTGEPKILRHGDITIEQINQIVKLFPDIEVQKELIQ
jgi:L-threonylcarbamoyladenylate synthase